MWEALGDLLLLLVITWAVLLDNKGPACLFATLLLVFLIVWGIAFLQRRP